MEGLSEAEKLYTLQTQSNLFPICGNQINRGHSLVSSDDHDSVGAMAKELVMSSRDNVISLC